MLENECRSVSCQKGDNLWSRNIVNVTSDIKKFSDNEQKSFLISTDPSPVHYATPIISIPLHHTTIGKPLSCSTPNPCPPISKRQREVRLIGKKDSIPLSLIPSDTILRRTNANITLTSGQDSPFVWSPAT